MTAHPSRRPRVSTAILVVLALFAAALAGCGSCGKPTPPPEPAASLEAFFPPQTKAIALVTDLAKLGTTAAALESTKLAELAAIAAGAKDASEFVKPLVAQLGFDPRTPEGFTTAGVDGAKGLAFGTDESGAELVVVGVADPGKLDAWLGRLAGTLGGTVRREDLLPAPNVGTVIVFAAGEGGPPAFAYARKGGFAVAAGGPTAIEAVTRALTRPRDQSLATSAAFAKTTGKLGNRDVRVWAEGGAKLMGRRKVPDSGVVAGVTASRTGVNVRLQLPQTPAQIAALKPAATPAGQELVALLPESSLFLARLGGEPTALRPLLDLAVSRSLLLRLKKAGFELETDILSLLKPGVAFGAGLASDLNLSGGLPGGDGAGDFNPFQFANVTLYARVKDPAAAQATLEKVLAAQERFKMKVDVREEAGAKVYVASYSQGEGMTWGLVGDMLVATGGKGQWERAKARLATPGTPTTLADPAAKALFEKAASAAWLDVPKLVASLRAVPESAYGVGGFRIKEIMETWIAMLDEVKGASAAFSVDEDAIALDADLTLK